MSIIETLLKKSFSFYLYNRLPKKIKYVKNFKKNLKIKTALKNFKTMFQIPGGKTTFKAARISNFEHL